MLNMNIVWIIWMTAAAAAAKPLQSCPILCNPINGSPPGSPIPGILWARTLGWVVMSFSNAWKWKVKVKLLSRVQLLVISWTADYQAPPSLGFSRQEYWTGLPLPSLLLWYTSLQIQLFISFLGLSLLIGLAPYFDRCQILRILVLECWTFLFF